MNKRAPGGSGFLPVQKKSYIYFGVHSGADDAPACTRVLPFSDSSIFPSRTSKLPHIKKINGRDISAKAVRSGEQSLLPPATDNATLLYSRTAASDEHISIHKRAARRGSGDFDACAALV